LKPFQDAPVVLVSIDTLRADRLPAYGYGQGSTPHLDALAREGIVFEDVVSACPLTLPAHASMFTGLLPPRHGVRDNAGFTLDAARRPLAARFHEAGFATGAAVSAYVLRRATGIAQGFDFYDDAIPVDATREGLGQQQRDGAAAVESLGAWVDARKGQRVFAFLHLYEPHAPYAPPPAFQRLAQPYDGEVAYADDLVGRLFDRLRAAGIFDRAIVAVTSDHGEGLGDHGEREHGFFVYRESVHVPLIVRLPTGRRGGTRVSGVVPQVDLPATLLDLAGVSADGMDGVSQRPAIESGRAAARPAYSETLYPRYHFGWSELRAVTDDRLRYIDAPRPELYDVRDDPRETRNLAASRGPAAAGMKQWLDRQSSGPPPAPAAVTGEVRERLEALGYAAHGAPAPVTGPPADPKDKVGVYEAYRDATVLRQQGRDADALAALEKVLADSPSMLDAREVQGMTLFRLGRANEAVAALDAVVAADPQRATAHLALARIHALAGRRELAERHAAQAAAGDPGRAFEMLAQTLLAGGKLDEAARFARRAVEADPDRAAAQVVLGIVSQRAGRCDEALARYRAADEARRRQPGLLMPGLHARMGDCLARQGREPEAERAFLDEIEALPQSPEGRVGLAILYRSQGRDADARDALAGVVTRHPHPGPEEYWTVVRTLTGLGDAEGARQWAAQARERFPADPRFR
jgi:arylsulfatase A-like enzyme/Tfp pilus assembly protein PilF